MNELLRDRSVSLAESEARGRGLAKPTGSPAIESNPEAFPAFGRGGSCSSPTSLFGTLANCKSGCRLKGKTSPEVAHLLGYGHLEKIVSTYEKWRATHPEAAAIDDQIQALISGAPSTLRRRHRRSNLQCQRVRLSFRFTSRSKFQSLFRYSTNFISLRPVWLRFRSSREPERFEVIVVDDCSTDGTAEVCSAMPGVVYLRNETNSGFIASCNRGAEKRAVNTCVFLNNDTLVTPGWLTALLDTFAEEPRAGIVGSKLVYPDGRLQEAGGIIWRDASGWNYGKFDDPRKPEYNYLREVDYCSAAALDDSKTAVCQRGRVRLALRACILRGH